MKELISDIQALQNRCEHPNVIISHNGDTGNWCKGDDSYWDEYKCPDCNKHWTI